MIYKYPNCPNYCDECSNIYGEIICTKCKGDRKIYGNVCKCTHGNFETG